MGDEGLCARSVFMSEGDKAPSISVGSWPSMWVVVGQAARCRRREVGAAPWADCAVGTPPPSGPPSTLAFPGHWDGMAVGVGGGGYVGWRLLNGRWRMMAGGGEGDPAVATTFDVKRGGLVPVPMRGTIGQRSSGTLPCPCVFADGASVCARVASHQQ